MLLSKVTTPDAKPKSAYTQEEYTAELVLLWEDVVRTVYLKEPGPYAPGIALEAWEGTNMTPLRYVIFIASPRMATNMILRGQKAREKRWVKWLKSKGVSPKEDD
jgi:hypothetical protein